MAEPDREQEVPATIAAALLACCGLAAVGALFYLLLLRHSQEPLHVAIPNRTDPPIQQQLNIDALVQTKRSLVPPPKPPEVPAADESLDGRKQVVPEKEYKSREARIGELLAELIVLLPEKFEARTYQAADGRVMPYRLFRPPGYSEGRWYPLILYLHGSSSRGSDNLANLQHSATLGAGVWTLAANQLREPCFVLVPQCPQEPARWVDNGEWGAASHEQAAAATDSLRLAGEVLDAIEKEFRIDRRRVYLVGASMGGFGVFDLACRQPRRFAGIVAVSGGLPSGQAHQIRDVPAWIFHGGRDQIVPARRSQDAFDELRQAGAKVRYTEYERAGHDAWKYAFTEPGLAEWLLAQRLP